MQSVSRGKPGLAGRLMPRRKTVEAPGLWGGGASEIAKALKIGRASVYRVLEAAE
jgi:hypothetical protein